MPTFEFDADKRLLPPSDSGCRQAYSLVVQFAVGTDVCVLVVALLRRHLKRNSQNFNGLRFVNNVRRVRWT